MGSLHHPRLFRGMKEPGLRKPRISGTIPPVTLATGLPAVLGLAAGAFAATNIDNAVVTVAMIAAAPATRSRRIAFGQVMGFTLVVIGALAMAALLFEIPTRVIGLLGLVPLILGVRALLGLRHAEERSRVARRAVGSGVVAALAVTVGAGGDNLAVYIPLFRVDHLAGTAETLLVFALGELLLTLFVLWAGLHPRVRTVVTTFGVFAAPILYCAIGLAVLFEAGTL
jgi:cadmium resistance protein CadD (predicted permease)